MKVGFDREPVGIWAGGTGVVSPRSDLHWRVLQVDREVDVSPRGRRWRTRPSSSTRASTATPGARSTSTRRRRSTRTHSRRSSVPRSPSIRPA